MDNKCLWLAGTCVLIAGCSYDLDGLRSRARTEEPSAVEGAAGSTSGAGGHEPPMGQAGGSGQGDGRPYVDAGPDADVGGAVSDAQVSDAGVDSDSCTPRTFYADADEDGYGNPEEMVEACEAPPGYVDNADDCNDACVVCYPGAEEQCDGQDNNCDGSVDEGCECSFAASESCGTDEGACERGTRSCLAGGWSRCEGGVTPSAERCDGIDNNCNGYVDETFPTLGNACTTGDGSCTRSGVTVCNANGSDVRCDAEVATSRTCGVPCSSRCAVAGECSGNADCQSQDCRGGLCRPACSGSCDLGDSCAADNDCAGTSFCDPVANVCVQRCSGIVITNQASVDARHWCGEIAGNILFQPGAQPELSIESLPGTAFPYLRRVTGNIVFSDPNARVTNVTFAVLDALEGSFLVGMSRLEVASFPMLRTVGRSAAPGTIWAEMSFLHELHMPRLVTMYGSIEIRNLVEFSQLDMQSLDRIAGDFELAGLSRLSIISLESVSRIEGSLRLLGMNAVPYSAVSHINTEGVVSHINTEGVVTPGTRTVSNVGCCYFYVPDYHNCERHSC